MVGGQGASVSAEPLSLRAYAKHRKAKGFTGTRLSAVQKAIRDGRLVDCLMRVGPDTRIADPEAADREWAANTDQTRRSAPSAGDDPESEEVVTSGFAYWKAKKMELDYRKAAGELVDAAEMQAEITDAFSTVRTKLMGVPSKVKQRHPELPLAVLATIDAAVREALEELVQEPSE